MYTKKINAYVSLIFQLRKNLALIFHAIHLSERVFINELQKFVFRKKLRY